MIYNIKKRVFWKGVKPNKTTMSFTDNMYKALEELSIKTGQSVPDLVSESLEMFLIEMCRSGMIKPPKGEEKIVNEILQELELKI